MKALGKYELIDQLGSGSMGIVYRARDTMLDREVALKILRAESKVDPEMSERFRREARACAQLHHLNIVTVYELGEAEDGVTYIAMELLHGMDWRMAARQPVRISVARKIELVAQLCDGLGHAHERGIVHRDIKPANLFLQDGNSTRILDFGIARLATSSLTRTGRVLGTPNYMAPEQITGEKCDSRSDLFSAAIVSFEFLTGQHPFQAPFIPRRIVNDEPEQLSNIHPDYPPELSEILYQAMARDPGQRFQTGEAFATALRTVIGLCDASTPDDHPQAATTATSNLDASTASLLDEHFADKKE